MVELTERRTYVARCFRDHGWWAVEVEGVKSAYTQARRLDRVEPIVRDLLALLLDVPADSFNVRLDIQVPSLMEDAVDDARRYLAERAAAEERVAVTLPRAVAGLRDAGLTVRDIARLLGVSFQRVAQLSEEARPPRSGARQRAALAEPRSAVRPPSPPA